MNVRGKIPKQEMMRFILFHNTANKRKFKHEGTNKTEYFFERNTKLSVTNDMHILIHRVLSVMSLIFLY